MPRRRRAGPATSKGWPGSHAFHPVNTIPVLDFVKLSVTAVSIKRFNSSGRGRILRSSLRSRASLEKIFKKIGVFAKTAASEAQHTRSNEQREDDLRRAVGGRRAEREQGDEAAHRRAAPFGCADLARDHDHCGTCATACSATQLCVQSACRDFLFASNAWACPASKPVACTVDGEIVCLDATLTCP